MSSLFKILLLSVVAGVLTPAFGQNRYSVRDLRGTYVFTYQGTLVNTQTAQPIPVAAIGLLTLDGEGKVTRATRHLNIAGQVVRASATGTYTVSPDGIGTATYSVQPLVGEPPIVPPTQEVFHFVMKNRTAGVGIGVSVRGAGGENIGLVAIVLSEFVRQEEP